MSIIFLPNRFSKQDRLLSSKDFQDVFAKPIKSSDSAYTVLARPNQLSGPRLGVIVSKKNVPKAVVRNRLKRVVRESFRTHKNIISAFDVVVICKKNSANILNQSLAEKLQKHWKSLNTHAE
ncbi:MAG: ribonuclease P protein component [Gammaproteobacteria bacterium]|nr:ribonuclease P protein component [Gammaproteobacteria bacterium]